MTPYDRVLSEALSRQREWIDKTRTALARGDDLASHVRRQLDRDERIARNLEATINDRRTAE